MEMGGVISRIAGTPLKIQLSAIQDTTEDESEYGSFVELAGIVFKNGTWPRTWCGTIITEIVNTHTFLIFDEEN